jgi:hypothetical protein
MFRSGSQAHTFDILLTAIVSGAKSEKANVRKRLAVAAQKTIASEETPRTVAGEMKIAVAATKSVVVARKKTVKPASSATV